MRKVFDAISKTQKELDASELNKNSVFAIFDVLSEGYIKNDPSIPRVDNITSQYFSCRGGTYDTPIGEEFEVVFPLTNPKKYVVIESKLEYVNVNKKYQIDYLPSGYSGICLIDFPKGKPEILNKLSEFRSENKSKSNDILYLTTQSVMDKILENLD